MHSLLNIIEKLECFSVHLDEIEQYILNFYIRVLEEIRKHLNGFSRKRNVISVDHLNQKFQQTTFLHGNLELCKSFLSFKVYSFVDWIRGQVVFDYSIEDFQQIKFVFLRIETLHHVLDKLFDHTILIVFIGLIKHKAYFSGQVCNFIVCTESLEKVKEAFCEK